MGTNFASEFALGIDLGGTGIKAAVVSDSGQLMKTWSIPTEAEKGGEHVIRKMIGLCRTMLEELPEGIETSQVIGIGIGSPGVFNFDTGELVAGAVNIEGLSGTPMREIFERELGLPTRVDNDANVFSLAEARWGAGCGSRVFLGYTLGTGVGGGVVIGGHVVHGAWGFAGELGHMTVDPEGIPCPCGNRGCLEVYASANAIAKYARQLVREGKETCLTHLPEERISCKAVGEAAKGGDPIALSVVRRAAYYLGVGIGSAVICLNPDAIVIGGGGGQLGEMLFEPLREELMTRVYHQKNRACPVVGAKLGTDSGMIGAGALVFAEKETGCVA